MACCLPPKAPPGSGAMTRTFAKREPHDLRDDVLESERVLDRTEDNQSIVVRGSQKDVGFYGEVCDHGEPVGVLDDPVGRRRPPPRPSQSAIHAGCSCRPAGRRHVAPVRQRAENSAGAHRPRSARPPVPRTRRGLAPLLPQQRPRSRPPLPRTGSPWNFVSPTADRAGPGRWARTEERAGGGRRRS